MRWPFMNLVRKLTKVRVELLANGAGPLPAAVPVHVLRWLWSRHTSRFVSSAIAGVGALWIAGCTAIPADPADIEGFKQTRDDGPGVKSMVQRGVAELPRNLPKSRIGNPESYVVFGKRYKVMDSARGFRESGIASWYGTKFHGRKTSSGETYNMYNITAAHKHLPLPTFVQVTNLENGKSLVVKVNDRGPFVGDRIIDLSYGAAAKLGVLEKGTARVDIVAISENIDPSDKRAPESMPEPELMAAKPTNEPGRLARLPAQDAAIATSSQVLAPTPESKAQSVAATGIRESVVEEAKGTVIQVGAYSSRENAEIMKRRVDSAMQEPAALVLSDRDKLLHRVQVGPLPESAPIKEILARLQLAGIEKVTIFER